MADAFAGLPAYSISSEVDTTHADQDHQSLSEVVCSSIRTNP